MGGGDQSKEAFPLLLSLASHKNAIVANLWERGDNGGHWFFFFVFFFFDKCKCIRIKRSIHDVYKGTKKPKKSTRIQKTLVVPYKEPIQSTNSNNDKDLPRIYILIHSQNKYKKELIIV